MDAKERTCGGKRAGRGVWSLERTTNVISLRSAPGLHSIVDEISHVATEAPTPLNDLGVLSHTKDVEIVDQRRIW